MVILLCLSSLTACFTPDAIVKSERKAESLIHEDQVYSRTVTINRVDLHYVVAGGGPLGLIVFVHGTPGDWTIFSPQFESQHLIEQATLVGIDRPGWGRSSALSADADLSLSAQSKKIGPLLSELKRRYAAQKLVLVGHSLGGSLVPRLAMDFPEDVDGVVVLAGDLSDEYPAARWYNELASWKVLSWALPDMLVLANKEVLVLNNSLAQMRPLWSQLAAPMLVIQGAKDSLVDPRHADFAEALRTKNTVRVERFPDGNHLVHLSAADAVNDIILRFVKDDVLGR